MSSGLKCLTHMETSRVSWSKLIFFFLWNGINWNFCFLNSSTDKIGFYTVQTNSPSVLNTYYHPSAVRLQYIWILSVPNKRFVVQHSATKCTFLCHRTEWFTGKRAAKEDLCSASSKMLSTPSTNGTSSHRCSRLVEFFWNYQSLNNFVTMYFATTLVLL